MTTNPKPKIALMTYAIDGRMAKGTAIVARKNVEELTKYKDQFDLTFIHFDKIEDPIYTHGIREVIFPTFKWKIFNRRFFRMMYYFFTTKDQYDIVHWFQARLYPFFWLAPTKHIIASLHGAGDWDKNAPFDMMRHVFNWSARLFNKKIRYALAGSQYAKNDIIKHYNIADERVLVVHYGAEAMYYPRPQEEITILRQKYNLPDKFVMNVARLNHNKNAFTVIRSFVKYLKDSGDTETCFVNIGAKGVEEEQVKAFIENSGYKDRITLVGYVETEDLAGFYCSSLGLVFPLLFEGFGLPIIEAMKCGIPTIISKTAYPEITTTEAILVDPYSEAEIASAIVLMLTDSTKRDSLIENGKRFAAPFTWEEMGRNLVKIYNGLLK